MHKFMPDKLIGQFNTTNKTSRERYFDTSWRTRSEFHSQKENRFISPLRNYTVLVPTMIRLGKIHPVHILPLS